MNKELEEFYSKIPAIDCQGLCYDQCTLIIAHPVELDNIGLDPHFKTLDDGKVLVHLIKQDWNVQCLRIINVQFIIKDH